jgi:ABC-type transport system involved in multi-copper enzyme maturation permease subunit
MGFASKLNPLDIFGPIFGNELTRASRKRRNYALRLGYVLVMLIVMGISWSENMPSSDNIQQIMSMSKFGLNMVLTIGVFQFFALQIIAPAITGSAISEEIRKQTLLSLMMTPISSFQIVAGKLLSRMMMIFLLVATSFPVLAILRVFGGVEWNLVLSMEMLTLCAALFAAALSLMFSTFLKKRVHDPAALTFLVLLSLYIFIPGILSVLHERLNWYGSVEDYWFYFNPFASMSILMSKAMQSNPVGGAWTWSSPMVQSGLLIGATAMVILITALWIRTSAIRQASGEVNNRTKKIKKDGLITAVGSEGTPFEGEVMIEPPKSDLLKWTKDRPVLWKDLRTAPWMINVSRRPMLHKVLGYIMMIVLVGIPLVIAIYPMGQRTRPIIALIVVEICTGMMLLHATSSSSSGFAKEREANTLELLLTTPLTAKEIVWDKVWFGLIGLLSWMIAIVVFLIMFILTGLVSPLGALGVLIAIAGPVFFIICSGVYFSIGSKDTRSSSTKNFLLAFLLWAPCCPISSLLSSLYFPANPFFNVYFSMNSFEGFPESPHYFFGIDYAWLFMPIATILYISVGWLLVKRAIARFYRFTLNIRQSAVVSKG